MASVMAAAISGTGRMRSSGSAFSRSCARCEVSWSSMGVLRRQTRRPGRRGRGGGGGGRGLVWGGRGPSPPGGGGEVFGGSGGARGGEPGGRGGGRCAAGAAARG